MSYVTGADKKRHWTIINACDTGELQWHTGNFVQTNVELCVKWIYKSWGVVYNALNISFLACHFQASFHHKGRCYFVQLWLQPCKDQMTSLQPMSIRVATTGFRYFLQRLCMLHAMQPHDMDLDRGTKWSLSCAREVGTHCSTQMTFGGRPRALPPLLAAASARLTWQACWMTRTPCWASLALSMSLSGWSLSRDALHFTSTLSLSQEVFLYSNTSGMHDVTLHCDGKCRPVTGHWERVPSWNISHGALLIRRSIRYDWSTPALCADLLHCIQSTDSHALFTAAPHMRLIAHREMRAGVPQPGRSVWGCIQCIPGRRGDRRFLRFALGWLHNEGGE